MGLNSSLSTEDVRPNPHRRFKLYTGLRGADAVEEAFDREFGFERIYIKKLPRFLRLRLKSKIRVSPYTGREYKLVNISHPTKKDYFSDIKLELKEKYKALTKEDVEKALHQIFYKDLCANGNKKTSQTQ